jgi:DNA (cytosine-5)-methyltransferase 1
LRELWDMGWAPAAGAFSAAEVGAPHERLRWFCVAYRDRDEPSANGGKSDAGPDRRDHIGGGGGKTMAHAEIIGEREPDDTQQPKPWQRAWPTFGGRCGGYGCALDHSASARCEATRQGSGAIRQGGQRLSGNGCNEMVDAQVDGRRKGWPGPELWHGRDATHASAGGAMADACQPGLQGRERAGSHAERHGPPASRPTSECGGLPLFPPGPGDLAGWAAVLAARPDLAPSLSVGDVKRACDHFAALVQAGRMEEAEAESRVCRVAHGLSSRAPRLRLLGNAVVPIQAAYAWVTLSRAHGLGGIEWGGR